jgi:hypothetical protein
MEPGIKKALMIAGIVLFTVLMIHIITNTPVNSSGSSKTTTKTVVVRDNNPHRYYYGYGNPHYNSYKSQYYN